MSVDEALLLDAAERGMATLRFYGWNEPTLSLGYFQRYDDRYTHPASRDCAIVRRQSGGGAILHDRELTYSLALPAAHPLARQSQLLYTAVHEAFIDALKQVANTRDYGWTFLCHDQDSTPAPSEEPFLCFQRRAFGDVLLVPEDQTAGTAASGRESTCGSPGARAFCQKILGSAQRRLRGAILQHGSLLLEKSPHAPELAGVYDRTTKRIRREKLIVALSERFDELIEWPLSDTKFPMELEPKAIQLAQEKYGSANWTKRR
jgi:lipoate-protein ligase A